MESRLLLGALTTESAELVVESRIGTMAVEGSGDGVIICSGLLAINACCGMKKLMGLGASIGNWPPVGTEALVGTVPAAGIIGTGCVP